MVFPPLFAKAKNQGESYHRLLARVNDERKAFQRDMYSTMLTAVFARC
jgi:hypothetical protein